MSLIEITQRIEEHGMRSILDEHTFASIIVCNDDQIQVM